MVPSTSSVLGRDGLSAGRRAGRRRTGFWTARGDAMQDPAGGVRGERAGATCPVGPATHRKGPESACRDDPSGTGRRPFPGSSASATSSSKRCGPMSRLGGGGWVVRVCIALAAGLLPLPRGRRTGGARLPTIVQESRVIDGVAWRGSVPPRCTSTLQQAGSSASFYPDTPPTPHPSQRANFA